jgi:hydroxypyruvate isomerase
MDRREFLGAAAATAAAAVSPAAASRGVCRREPFRRKFAPHFGMFRHHADDPIDQIAFMADQGFRALEDNGLRGRGAEMQERIRKALERHGMEMGIFVANDKGIGHGPILASGDAASRDAFLANIRESVDVAKRIGTKVCTVVAGDLSQRLPPGFQFANVVDALKRAAAICEPHGLVMVCEPLNPWRDHPGYWLVTTDQAYAVMKAVGSPSCKILFDIYHQQVSEGNVLDNIDRAWDEIGYFQIGDVPGRKEPTTGELNYRNIFRHIAAKGYDGILGMEHGNSRPGKDGELAVIAAYRACDDF